MKKLLVVIFIINIILISLIASKANASDTLAVELGSVVFKEAAPVVAIKYRRFYSGNTGWFIHDRLAHWRGAGNSDSGTLNDINVGYRVGSKLFIELSTGPGYLFDPDGKTLSGHIQFSSGGAVGYRFKRVTATAGYRHISNADIKTPNAGKDIVHAGLEWRFK